VLGRNPHLGLRRIGAESRRPAERRLGPERDIAYARHRDRGFDGLAAARVGRVELQIERELFTDRAGGWIGGGGRQWQHRDRNRIAAQRVPFFATEEREGGGQRILDRCRRNDQAARRERKHHLVGDEQIHPVPAYLARQRDTR